MIITEIKLSKKEYIILNFYICKMKSISMFIMILICMVSFTSTATTAKTEQKRKTEFVKTFNVEANAVSVVNEINVLLVIADETIETEFEVKSFEPKEPITFEAKNDDVGWQSKKTNSIIFYKEKLKNSLALINSNIRNSRNNC